MLAAVGDCDMLVEKWGRFGNRRLRFSLCTILNALVIVTLRSRAKHIGEGTVVSLIMPVLMVYICVIRGGSW